MHPEGELGSAGPPAEPASAMPCPPFPVIRSRPSPGGKGPLFLQVYLLGGRAAGEATLERARKAGYKGLFLTIDTPVAGMRERDFRNGMKELMGSNPFAMLHICPTS